MIHLTALLFVASEMNDKATQKERITVQKVYLRSEGIGFSVVNNSDTDVTFIGIGSIVFHSVENKTQDLWCPIDLTRNGRPLPEVYGKKILLKSMSDIQLLYKAKDLLCIKSDLSKKASDSLYSIAPSGKYVFTVDISIRTENNGHYKDLVSRKIAIYIVHKVGMQIRKEY